MTFNDGTDNSICQLIWDFTTADSNDYPVTKITRDVNSALNRYWLLALQSDGRWQVDDSNQTDYPVITMNLVDQQQDYSLTLDGSSVPNQILEIQRVEVKDVNGNWVKLEPIDITQIEGATGEFWKTPGMPRFYDKNATGLFLYPAPATANVTTTSGMKVFISRTPTYFTSSDTTKSAGLPRLFDEYLALRPAYQFCLRKLKGQTPNLKQDMLAMEEDIKDFYSKRMRDEKKVLTGKYRSSR